jgi:hypothetical protein
LDPFTIALATFGVQKLRGKSTKRSLRDAMMAGGLGQLGGMAGVGGLTPFGSAATPGTIQGLGQTTIGSGIKALMNPATTMTNPAVLTGAEVGIGVGSGAGGIGVAGSQLPQTISVANPGSFLAGANATRLTPTATQPNFLQKIIGSKATPDQAALFDSTGKVIREASAGTPGTGFMGLPTAAKIGIGATAIPLVGEMFAGDEGPQKYAAPIANQQYGNYARSGLPGTPTGFMIQDYQTGNVNPLADASTYKVAEDILGDAPTQEYRQVEIKNEGGLMSIAKFNEGGQILPSKFTHDENDINNYERANGFVKDGTGNGKDHEDTMLAQLADGEFVSRSHAVLGAGIIAGASIQDKKEQRTKGAKFFYDQQKQFKRIFDLINANKNRTNSVH